MRATYDELLRSLNTRAMYDINTVVASLFWPKRILNDGDPSPQIAGASFLRCNLSYCTLRPWWCSGSGTFSVDQNQYLTQVWNCNRGQNIWNASHSNILENMFGKYGNPKHCASICFGKFGKNCSIKTTLTVSIELLTRGGLGNTWRISVVARVHKPSLTTTRHFSTRVRPSLLLANDMQCSGF